MSWIRFANSSHEVHDQPQHNTTNAERQAAMLDDQINRLDDDSSGRYHFIAKRRPTDRSTNCYNSGMSLHGAIAEPAKSDKSGTRYILMRVA
jgi:hypothetical protein